MQKDGGRLSLLDHHLQLQESQTGLVDLLNLHELLQRLLA
jgi:hypothetical protein